MLKELTSTIRLPPSARDSSGPDPPPLPGRLAAIVDSLLAVLIAPACAACGRSLQRPLGGAVCPDCWSAIAPFTPPLCQRCGDPLPSWRVISAASGTCPRCRRRVSDVAAARAIGAYEGPLRSIVHALKYGGRETIAKPLAALMRERAADLLDGVDVAIPVPLHRRRRRARGFNQAEALARHLGVPWLDALRRTRPTPPQADLPAARRHANVRDAFALALTLAPRRDLRGLCVLLVDDVSTTGATLESCARVAKAAGAREVRAITAARVVSRSP